MVKLPVMFRLLLVTPLKVAPLETARLPLISTLAPIKANLPSVDTLPRVSFLLLPLPLWACKVTFALLLMSIFPVMLLLESSPPRVTLPAKMVIFLTDSIAFLWNLSPLNLSCDCLMFRCESVAFMVKSLLILKALSPRTWELKVRLIPFLISMLLMLKSTPLPLRLAYISKDIEPSPVAVILDLN
ncbi:hypothetical protein BVZ61_00317 [Haemophilus influenzae]|nr:hypothetical protein BVZ61_00317 [Haemophilus influenzae]PRM52026.1 hypothetical protein BVZ60_00805 [Haemophilus influenzae]